MKWGRPCEIAVTRSTAGSWIVICADPMPRRAISASSSRAMRGIRTWTSARSTERCSRISSSTVSATPMSTSVAGTARSESSLMVSVKSARQAALERRSNSSRKIGERPRLRECLERARDGVRRHGSVAERDGRRGHDVGRGGREPDAASLGVQRDLAERLPPHRREVVARVAGRARGEHAAGREQLCRRPPQARSCRRRARRRRPRAGRAAPRPRRARRSRRCAPRRGSADRPAPPGGRPARRAASARAAPARRACVRGWCAPRTPAYARSSAGGKAARSGCG